MSLQPLMSAAPAIQLHAAAALLALGLGIVQLLRPKGRGLHRGIGYLWATCMMTAAASSFWIHGIDQWRGFSLIHLLSINTMVSLPTVVWAARRGDIARHRAGMKMVFWTGLVLPGLLTLLPGRLISRAVFGG